MLYFTINIFIEASAYAVLKWKQYFAHEKE